MVNFYRRFIPAAANILLPLTDALRADWSWSWAPAMQHSFQLVKETLAAVATLTHPDPAAYLSLPVDASNTHIGAVLQQWQPGGGGRSGGWRPLSFFSKKLDSAQLKYSAFDRELLAAYLSVRHFRYMLDGRKFHILSDHKPLTQALHRVSDPCTPRVRRRCPPCPCPRPPPSRFLHLHREGWTFSFWQTLRQGVPRHRSWQPPLHCRSNFFLWAARTSCVMCRWPALGLWYQPVSGGSSSTASTPSPILVSEQLSG
jgi:hypothetical protein